MDPDDRTPAPAMDAEQRRTIHAAADRHFAEGGLVRGAGGLLYSRIPRGSGCDGRGEWRENLERWPADPRAAPAIAASLARDVRALQRAAVDRAAEWIFSEARHLGGIEHVDARQLARKLYP